MPERPINEPFRKMPLDNPGGIYGPLKASTPVRIRLGAPIKSITYTRSGEAENGWWADSGQFQRCAAETTLKRSYATNSLVDFRHLPAVPPSSSNALRENAV
jgi:hypothetical protein